MDGCDWTDETLGGCVCAHPGRRGRKIPSTRDKTVTQALQETFEGVTQMSPSCYYAGAASALRRPLCA
eukprot:1618710-Pyramimonas_sp.AAC.1